MRITRATPEPAAGARPARPARRGDGRGALLAVLSFCFGCVALDNTKLVAALPTLARAWPPGTPGLTWVVPANLVVYVSLLLLGGAMSERFGARRALLAGLAVFGLSSLAAAWAPSPVALVGARMVLGVGAALMTPATLATIKHAFDEGERARAVAVWTASFGVAAAAGPVLAGLLLARWGWRAVLVVNVPAALVGFVAARAFVADALPRRAVPFDGAGAALSFTSASALVFAILGGPSRGWLRADVLGAFAAAAIAGALLAAWEVRARHPMLDAALFRRPRFRLALVLIVLSYLAYAGVTFVLAQYFQVGRSRSPLTSGLLSTPLPVSMLVGTLLAPRVLARAGLERALALSLALAAMGTLVLVVAAARGDVGLLVAGQALLGSGAGSAFANATEMVIGAVPLERAGSAAAINETTFELGGVLGVAVMSALLEPRGPGFAGAGEAGGRTAAMVDGAVRALGAAAAAMAIAAAIAARASRAGARASLSDAPRSA